MDKERLSGLLAKKVAGEIDPEELRELQEYLQSNAGDRYFADILQTFWAAGGNDRSAQYNPGIEARFQNILKKAATPEKKVLEAVTHSWYRRRIFRFTSAAAAFLALCLFAWQMLPLVFNRQQQAAGTPNEVVIRRGAKSKVILPDGTQVWLNSDSKLIYPSVFSDTLREVSLEGEGYFIVTKDASKPFVVHTDEINIHVIGTVFNVKSYLEDATVETTLLQGSVAVEKRNTPNSSRIILQPREKLVIQKKEEPSSATAVTSGPTKNTGIGNNPAPAQLLSVTQLPQNVPDSTRMETSWVYGRLVFEGDHFVALAHKMERWYNKKITIRDSRVASYRFTGMFENETLEESLRALQLTAAFRFRIDGNEVFIDKP